MIPTLRTIMNSSYYYEYGENIHLGVKLTPAKHFGCQTDVQHSFIYAVFILSFNILVSRNSEFVSFSRTFYWSTTHCIKHSQITRTKMDNGGIIIYWCAKTRALILMVVVVVVTVFWILYSLAFTSFWPGLYYMPTAPLLRIKTPTCMSVLGRH